MPGTATEADHVYADGPHPYTVTAAATLSDGSVVVANQTTTSIAQGQPDPTFGVNGQVVTSFPAGNAVAAGIATLDNGQFVVAGAINNAPVVVRYNADGSVDSTFGVNGTLAIPNASNVVAVLDQHVPDPYAPGTTVERLVVVGNIVGAGGYNAQGYVWRFDLGDASHGVPDGTPDATFGKAGVAALHPALTGTTYESDSATAATVTPTGQIVVVGSAAPVASTNFTYKSEYFLFARLNADGSPDAAFGTNGEQTTSASYYSLSSNQSPLVATSVAVGPDGSVYTMTYQGIVSKVTPAGQPDAAFGNGGLLIAAPSDGVRDVQFNTLAIDTAGRLLLGGTYLANTTTGWAVGRYSGTTGAVDATYGATDPANVSIYPGVEARYTAHDPNEGITTLVALPSGKLLSEGLHVPQYGSGQMTVAQYNADGTPDTAFGTAGSTTVNFGATANTPAGLAVQADGKALAVETDYTGTADDFAIARLGLVSAATATPVNVAVANVAPTPTIAKPVTTGAEGTPLTLNGSATDPSPVDTAAGLLLNWSVAKNGATYPADSSTGTLSFTPDDNGTYVVTLTATDKDGGVGTTTDTIAVANVAPTPTIAKPVATGTEGTPITLAGSATDPSPVDTAAGLPLTWSVTKNGAAFATGTGPGFTFTPDDNGSYVVTLTATDKDGGVGTTTDTIAVANVPPTAVITKPVATGSEGTAITLTGTATDPSPADTAAGLALSWSVTKNGSAYATGTGSSFTFTPNDNGTYVATLTATDKDGGTGTATDTIAVANVAPTATAITPPAAAVRYQLAQFAASFADPGTLDTHTVTWSFGDGSTPVTTSLAAGVTGPVSASHAYAATGTYTVTLTITDKDGGTVTKATPFTVDAADLQADPATAGKTALYVGGTSGCNTILVYPACNGTLTASVNNVTYTNFAPTGRIVVLGGPTTNTIELSSYITLPSELYGGAGSNLIKGGGGPNIEVGGPSADILVAGTSRDVLIGGGGSDSLVGGGSNDLLIAMSTAYDHNQAALEAIQRDWLRTDITVAKQVTDLTKGGGLNGSYVLTPTTAPDDHAGDVLFAGGGTDVFFVDNGDTVVGASCGDTIVDLSWVTV